MVEIDNYTAIDFLAIEAVRLIKVLKYFHYTKNILMQTRIVITIIRRYRSAWRPYINRFHIIVIGPIVTSYDNSEA